MTPRPHQPILLVEDSPEDYEAVRGATVRKLLKERIKGPTVSQEEARAHILRVLQRASAKS